MILSITWNHFPSPPRLNSHHLSHSVVWSPGGFCTIWPNGLASKFQSKYYPISNWESILSASFWSNFSFSHPLPLIYSPILHALCHNTVVLCSLVLLTNKGHSPHLFSHRDKSIAACWMSAEVNERLFYPDCHLFPYLTHVGGYQYHLREKSKGHQPNLHRWK